MTQDSVTVTVDYDCDRWVAIDPRGLDPDEWAVAAATLSFRDAGEHPDADGVRRLSAALLSIHDRVEELSAELDTDYSAFLHLPSPHQPGPVAMLAIVFAEDGPIGAEAIAAYAGADDPDVAEPPRVEPFRSSLGDGLRVRRFTVTEQRRGLRRHRTVSLSYTYAWPVHEGDALIRLHVGGEDLAMMDALEDDFDALARSARLDEPAGQAE